MLTLPPNVARVTGDDRGAFIATMHAADLARNHFWARLGFIVWQAMITENGKVTRRPSDAPAGADCTQVAFARVVSPIMKSYR